MYINDINIVISKSEYNITFPERQASFIKQCLLEEKKIYSCEYQKTIKIEYVEKIENFIQKCFEERYCVHRHAWGDCLYFVYSSNKFVAHISKFLNNEIGVKIYSTDNEFVEKINKNLSECFLETTKDHVYAILLNSNQTPEITNIGKGGQKIIRENYSKEVLEGYDFLVKDLSSKNPYGRLSILDGAPGTGKSYLVRGLINQVDNVIFLLVPSAIIPQLSNPSFMKIIIDFHNRKKLPIILVLEDADSALLPRGTDNMSSISDLLNFADGIIGKIVDFRIVATTNAKKIEIEPALMRAGRLSKHVHVAKLEKEHAIMVFERLTERKVTDAEIDKLSNKTLAEVYELAHLLNTNTKEIKNEPRNTKIGY